MSIERHAASDMPRATACLHLFCIKYTLGHKLAPAHCSSLACHPPGALQHARACSLTHSAAPAPKPLAAGYSSRRSSFSSALTSAPLQRHQQRHQPFAEWQRKRKERQCLSSSPVDGKLRSAGAVAAGESRVICEPLHHTEQDSTAEKVSDRDWDEVVDQGI